MLLEEDRATATVDMHTEVKFEHAFFRYASGRTFRQTDRHTDNTDRTISHLRSAK